MQETSFVFPVIYQKNKNIRLVNGKIPDSFENGSMLVCSAYLGSYQEREGTLIGNLAAGGIHVGKLHEERRSEYSVFDGNDVERCWVSRELKDHGSLRVACIELLSPNKGQEDASHMDLLKDVFFLFRKMLRKMNSENKGPCRIIMTVPGIGNQGMEPAFVVPVLLSQLRALIKELEMLEEVVIYETDPEKYEKIKHIFDIGMPLAEKQVFISYSSKDSAEADEIYKYLTGKGVTCWKAPEDIPHGSNYQVMIPKGLQDTYILLLIQSPNSERSRWCFKEVGCAIGSGHTIVPYKTDDYPSSDQFNFLMDGEQIFFAYEYEKEQRLDKLYRIIEGYIKKHEMVQ